MTNTENLPLPLDGGAPDLPAKQTRKPRNPTQPFSQTASIANAISCIMAELQPVVKQGENKFHGYKYARAQDILQMLTPLLARHGLVIFQTECSRQLFDGDAVIAVTYEFTIAHISGAVWPDRPRQTGVCRARDSKGGLDDKAVNKCHTAARKYFLLALFQIPTEDMDDADAHETGGKPREPSRRIIPAEAKPPEAMPMADPRLQPNTPKAPVGGPRPIPLHVGREVEWGMEYLKAIRTAPDLTAIQEWERLNLHHIGQIELDEPAVHKRLKTAINEIVANEIVAKVVGEKP